MNTDVHVDVDNDTEADLDLERWSALVADALALEGVTGPAEAGVRFVTPDVIEELNRTYLGGDGPTDVLSFPLDGETAETADESGEDGSVGAPRLVGDIVVCPDIAAANAPAHAGTFDDEIALLLIHSTLHLLGHDHAAPDERAVMWAAERRLLDALWSPLSRDPWSTS